MAGNLAVELAYGYKQIISDLAGKTSGRRSMGVAVQRAMLFNLLAIIYDFDQYRSSHRVPWEELWSLFHFAKRQGFETAERARKKSGHVPIRILQRSGALVPKVLTISTPFEPPGKRTRAPAAGRTPRSKPRLTPLTPDEWSEEQHELLKSVDSVNTPKGFATAL